MPSILNSDDGVVSGTSGLKSTGGNDGLLNIQSNGSTVVAVTGSGISVTGTVSQTGVSTFAAGTASAPSITFTGDTNTGIFSPAADTIAFTEGGTEAMRIDSSGNVGIGTNSITAFSTAKTLEIAGSSTNSAALRLRGGGDTAGTDDAVIYKVNGNTGAVYIRNYANGRLGFWTNNAQLVEFQTGGAVTLKGASDSANGTGITFPATQSASTDANTLDDYEEGTWTPSLGGNTTYNDRSGTYTKIGRLVYVAGIVSVNSIGTGSTSIISGLPFQSTSGFSAGSVTYYSGISSSAYNNPVPILESGTATTFGFSWNTAGATTVSQFRGAIFQNSARIDFGFVYIAA